MKRLFFLSLFLSNAAVAQFGAIDLTLTGKQGCFYDGMMVVLSSPDKTLDTLETDKRGHLIAPKLPPGRIHGALVERGTVIAGFDVEVQPWQLLQAVVEVIPGTEYAITALGTAVEYVPGAGMPVTISRKDIQRLPVRSASGVSPTMDAMNSVGGIEEVCIMAYRVPLIQKDGSSSMTITREDIGKVNSQTPLIDYRVPGTVWSSGELNVRGCRADANEYFIDGVKVRGSSRIPNSAIESVTVITGGHPANYGDVTGGVVAIQTRSYPMNRSFGGDFMRCGYNAKSIDFEEIKADRFAAIYENMFLETRDVPQSTFGIDVDRASWTYIQSALSQSGTVQRDAVKLEEMINSFDYKLPPVTKGKPLDVTFEQMSCPWNNQHRLVAVRLKAMDLPVQEKRPSHNLVFLVDVSGSMSSPDKLQLLQEGLVHFVQTLNADDRVSLVTYAGSSGVVLSPTSCGNKDKIITAIRALSSGGSTNGIGGIETAYKLAAESFLPGGNNRIILATDGDFNVGINNPSELENYISLQRGKGIYLTALGFGMGNYRNDILETLADRGDGNHFYIRDLRDCQQTLEQNLGNLINLARDVKLNVEFNPLEVKSYRLIGYENRLMPSEHFRDDTKDGGEIGYGHTVVAVYEIEPDPERLHLRIRSIQSDKAYPEDDLCQVSLRYKLLEATASTEETFHLSTEIPFTENRLLTTVIAFGLELRQSAYKGSCNKMMLKAMCEKLEGKTEQERELMKAMRIYLRI